MLHRHCEEQWLPAVQTSFLALDRFAAPAMTARHGFAFSRRMAPE
jgi:hypothetical protein